MPFAAFTRKEVGNRTPNDGLTRPFRKSPVFASVRCFP